MIFKTKVPGRVVQRRKRKPGGGYKVVPWFRFDENGLAELDETKVNSVTIQKLKTMFEVVEEKPEEENKETKTYKCKKCDFETESRGVLLAHYKHEHPKGAK